MTDTTSKQPMPPPSASSLRAQLSTYAQHLHSFTASSQPFRILHSLPPSIIPLHPLPCRTLYILDSSFNPPTLAHRAIALSALLHDPSPSPPPKRLLLLLATQNADKAPKPAPFPQRLLMMQLFASDLLNTLKDQQQPDIGIDIGVTKLPYFCDKATAIASSKLYDAAGQDGAETTTTQVHLTGYDTLIRFLDPKYYPPDHTLLSLRPFLASHRLRVTYRPGSEWGSRDQQDSYLRGIAEGERDAEGADRAWVTEGRIVLCEGMREGEEAVSSTRVRRAVRDGNDALLGRLISEGVKGWILEEGLYLHD